MRERPHDRRTLRLDHRRRPVRLPVRPTFSEKLWTVTQPGTPVIIAGSHSDPWELTHPGLVLGACAEHQVEDALAALDGRRHPADWDRGAGCPVTTVVAATADGRIDLLENGDLVAEGRLAVKGLGDRPGSHVFVLSGTHEV